MGLPLQPDLNPPPPWMKRAIILVVLLLLVLLLGWWQQPWQTAPRLLHSQGGTDDFVSTLEQRFDQAEERIWVMLYVLRQENSGQGPVSRLVSALARARQRGVDVRVVLDQSIRWGSDELDPKHLHAAAWLESHDIPVIIDSLEQRTHAKAILIDSSWLIIGSHNWTFSALARNLELSILIECPRLAAALAEQFRLVPTWDDS